MIKQKAKASLLFMAAGMSRRHLHIALRQKGAHACVNRPPRLPSRRA